MRRINLLRAHGSPTGYHYTKGCRCAACRGAHADYKRRWRQANLISTREYDSAYNAAHSGEKAARRVAYNLEHLADRTAYGVAYYVANREERAVYAVAYRAEHPEVCAAYNRNRRARKRGNGGTHTAADIRAQYERQRGKCFWQASEPCKARSGKLGDTYHVDHVTPVILGGSSGPENLVIACPTCNMTKNAKHPMDFAGVMF